MAANLAPAGSIRTTTERSKSKTTLPVTPFTYLRVYAETFADLQKLRIATGNRVGKKRKVNAVGHPIQHDLDIYVTALEGQENVLRSALIKEFRLVAPPGIRAWQQATVGIGEPLLARFLGHLGHPRHATPKRWVGDGKGERVLVEDPPFDRTVAQLWAYCGLGDPARKRRKAMLAEDAFALGSPTLKMLAHLMAECCMKQMRSPYRAIYDNRRAVTATLAPAGSVTTPTERSVGSSTLPVNTREWTPGHQHADALRVTAKAILKDLYRAAGA